MTVIHTDADALKPDNRPAWVQTPAAGYFRISKDGGEHDCHYHDFNELYLHDFNELYLICRGMAKVLNDGTEVYVQARDIVCIKGGDEHDILEVYGDEDLELYWLYEPGQSNGRLGHLHRSPEKARPHPVPAQPIPADFPMADDPAST
jgi:mannose-6-phosphate isomerase-like protein (cupin superfamily)